MLQFFKQSSKFEKINKKCNKLRIINNNLKFFNRIKEEENFKVNK